MSVQIKFCGMMRTADVDAALAAGAGFVGAVLAGGPRQLSRVQALATLRPAGDRARRVAVISVAATETMAKEAEGFDIVQLHGDATPETVGNLREKFAGEIWAVVRSEDGEVPNYLNDLYATADAVLFDRKTQSGLGGSGQPLDWGALSQSLSRIPRGRTILAGGLTAATVGTAIAALRPDIVDVSSGVESAPGIKDHALIRAFADAVASSEGAS